MEPTWDKKERVSNEANFTIRKWKCRRKNNFRKGLKDSNVQRHSWQRELAPTKYFNWFSRRERKDYEKNQ